MGDRGWFGQVTAMQTRSFQQAPRKPRLPSEVPKAGSWREFTPRSRPTSGDRQDAAKLNYDEHFVTSVTQNPSPKPFSCLGIAGAILPDTH
jgi:hypothetical protein